MAYSDYGGFAYKDRELIMDRSDCMFYPIDGSYISSPGVYPGFVCEDRSGSSVHVLLGDMALAVGLRKQSTVYLWFDGEEKSLFDLVKTKYSDLEDEVDMSCRLHHPFNLELDGYKLSVCWMEFSNYYVCARIVQPDGTEWVGYSGYHIGAGFEGKNTSDIRKIRLLIEELETVV